MEVVVFDSQSGKTVVRKDQDIVLSPAEHYDLDTGAGCHAAGRHGLRDANYCPDLVCGSADGSDGYFAATDGAIFLFPIGDSGLDASR